MDRFETMQQPESLDSSFVADREARVLAARRKQALMRQLEEDFRSISMVSQLGSTPWPSPASRLQQPQLLQQSAMGRSFFPGLVNPNEDSVSAGELSIAESLRSPGQFGTHADWSPPPQQQQQTHATHASRCDAVNYEQPASIEFTPILPPSSFPPGYESTAPRPPSRRGYDSYAGPPQPHSLMEMGFGHGARMLFATGQMVDSSTGFVSRPVRWAEPANAYVNSLPAYLRQQWQREQNEPPARRARPTIAASSRRRNSCSSTDSSSLGSSRGSSGNATECSYCASVGKPKEGHNKYNCHVLAHLPPCRICGASGKYNHTESHCPSMEKTVLQFIEKPYRRRNITI